MLTRKTLQLRPKIENKFGKHTLKWRSPLQNMSTDNSTYHQSAGTKTYRQHTSNQSQPGNVYTRLDVNGTKPNLRSSSWDGSAIISLKTERLTQTALKTRANLVIKATQLKEDEKGEDNGNQIWTHGWRQKGVKSSNGGRRNDIQNSLSVMTYFIGKTDTEMFVWKWLHTSMALAIALLTLSMSEIETLNRGLDKSYLICTC